MAEINNKWTIIEINADPSKQSQDELGRKGVESIASAVVVESWELDLTLGLGFFEFGFGSRLSVYGKRTEKITLRLFQ